MKKMIKFMVSILIVSVFCTGFLVASGSAMEGHDKTNSDKIGDLIHESKVDGYMLSYYFMDLRDQKGEKPKSMDMGKKGMPKTQMDKPHHLMVYIMDKNQKQVMNGKVGFMIKDAKGNAQKSMGMFMTNGFGTTADMKKKGVYTITTKAMINNEKLMYNFDYEIK
ncbi:MAG: hypothetical protein L3J69_13790 [Desulfobacula sp.]|nr:hypothetical protein [Desulfobacula sp.]